MGPGLNLDGPSQFLAVRAAGFIFASLALWWEAGLPPGCLDGEVPVLPACQLQPWLSSVLLALMGFLGPLLPTARVRQRGDIKALEPQIKGPGCIY